MTQVTSNIERSRHVLLKEVRELYDAKYPKKESGVFTEFDWNRCETALRHITGTSVLEVGVGPGQLFGVLARDKSIEHLTGVDIRWNTKLIPPPRGDLQLANVINLPFATDSFECVSCMEVLEHLETIDFPKALEEIRRVCRGTLISTIPYEEPHPVWHYDRPGGHRQSFSEEKIQRFFPRAERLLISRGPKRWSWIMLIERFDQG